MTREVFVNHWKDRLAGLALCGLVADTDGRTSGPYDCGKRAMELPRKVETLLGQLFDTAQQALAPVNGKPAPAAAAKAAS